MGLFKSNVHALYEHVTHQSYSWRSEISEKVTGKKEIKIRSRNQCFSPIAILRSLSETLQ